MDELAEIAESFKLLNESSPIPRPSKNANFELMNWKIRLSESQINTFSDPILTGDCHSSKAMLEELQPIKLHDMKLPMTHLGYYLVCKSICMPMSISGVVTLIQDLNGDVEELSLYNFRYNLDDLKWLNEGTIMIIKEPYMCYTFPDKVVSLKVESPTNVIFVDPTDYDFLKKVGAEKWYVSMSKDVEEIRQKANESFKIGDYEKAIMLYDRAIRYKPELAVLYLNKAMACLRINSYHMAYESAKIGLEKGGDPEKALHRMGMAAYGMRQWQKAAQHFIEMLKQFPKHPSASDQLKKTTARLNEQKTGKYDFKTMFAESQDQQREFDVADYKGPIEIANIPGKGIIASKDIQKGTLLVVSKAFAAVRSEGYLAAFNIIRSASDTAADLHLGIRIMENLQKNPQRTKELYDLYSGDCNETEEIPDGVVDVARIQQICACNSFGSRFEDSQDCQLFVVPSYFNHSCLANAARIMYGDVMVFHASSNIKKGEEICISYISPLFEYSERKKKLNSWKFECHCKLCQVDAKDSYCLQRNEIWKEFSEYVQQHENYPHTVVKKGEMLLKKMRAIFDTFVSLIFIKI